MTKTILAEVGYGSHWKNCKENIFLTMTGKTLCGIKMRSNWGTAGSMEEVKRYITSY